MREVPLKFDKKPSLATDTELRDEFLVLFKIMLFEVAHMLFSTITLSYQTSAGMEILRVGFKVTGEVADAS